MRPTERIGESASKSIILFLVLVSVYSSKAVSQQEIDELLTKLVETQDNFQSFVVKIESRTEGIADLPGKPQQEFNKKIVSEYRSDGNRFCHRFSSSNDNQRSYTSHLWQGDTWYATARGGQDPGRLIITKARDPIKDKQRFSRGKSIGPWLGYFYGDDERIDTVLREAINQGGRVSVQEGIKDTGESHYSVITAETKRGKYTLWLDTEKDYNIVKAIVDKRSGNSFYDQPPIVDGEYSYYKLDYIQYKKRGATWIPQKAKWHIKRKALQGYFESTTECLFTEVTLNPDHEALGSFVLDDVIDGAKVYIRGVPGITYTWRHGDLIPDIDEAAIDQLDKMAKEITAKGDNPFDRDGADRADKKTVLSPSELLDKYAATQNLMKSFRAKAETTVVDTGSVAKVGRMEEKCDFRYDGSRVCHRSYVYTGVAGARKEHQYTSFLWDGKRLIQYRRGSAGQSGQAYISSSGASKNEIVSTQYRGSALLGFCYGDYERIDSILRKAKSVSVREATELVGRSRCYVIDAVTERGKYSVWFDVEHSYNIAKMEVRRGAGDIIRNAERVKTDMRFLLSKVRFGSIEGLWFPVEADMETSQDNNSRITKWHHKRVEILSNPDHEGLGSFLANDINDGTDVTISGRYSEKYKWQGGNVVAEGGGNVKF